MTQMFFTSHLKALVPNQPLETPGNTVAEALEAAFQKHPLLRHYIVDEAGVMREHVCVFVDGERFGHRTALRQPVRENAEIYVMQALSGG